MLVVVMDDQGGGMFVEDSTISVSQGSYTSCSATGTYAVGRAAVWLVQIAEDISLLLTCVLVGNY